MLQRQGASVYETSSNWNGTTGYAPLGGSYTGDTVVVGQSWWSTPVVYGTPYYVWNNYPIYICTDKTKKAIEVLKALEADGLKVTSVNKFIALVEKIAGIL